MRRLVSPRIPIAAFYAAYFANMGILLPFLPPWLRGQGIDAASIGVLLSMQPAAKLLAPWTWGRWADARGGRRGLLVAGTLGAAVALLILGAGGPTSMLVLAALLAVYAFCTAPALPYAEATALEQSEFLGLSYGSMRLWGSVAFMGTSLGFGTVVDRVGGATGLWVAAGFLLLAAAAAAGMPAARAPLPDVADRVALPAPGMAWFFAAGALMQASHGAYYAFYSIRLQDLGYGGAAIGALWAFAVLCEIGMLMRADAIVRRFGSIPVMSVALGAAAVRWCVLAFATSGWVLAPAQSLHALTYAAFHVAALREVHRRFPAQARATGQSFYSGFTYGIGTIAGTLIAGEIANRHGIPMAFRVATGIAVLGWLVLTVSSRRERPVPSA